MSTTWSGPALATCLSTEIAIVTVAGALSCVPSLTMSCTTYVPGTSLTNVGSTDVGFDSVAALPVGLASMDHAYVSGSPSGSDERLPSRIMSVPAGRMGARRAMATGGDSSVPIAIRKGTLSAVPSFTMSCTT